MAFAPLSSMAWFHGDPDSGPWAKSKIAELDGVLVALGFNIQGVVTSVDGGRTWAYHEPQDDTEYFIRGRQLVARVGSLIYGAFNTGYGFRPCASADGVNWSVLTNPTGSNLLDLTAADWFDEFLTYFTGSSTVSTCVRSTNFTDWTSGPGNADHGWIDKRPDSMCVGGSKMVHTVTWQDPVLANRPAFSTDGGANWTLSSYGSVIAAANSARPNSARYLWAESADRFLHPVEAIYSDDLDSWSAFTPPYGTVHCGFHWDGKAVVLAVTDGEYALWETENATTWAKVSVLPESVASDVQYAYPVGENRVVFVTSDAAALVLEYQAPPPLFWTGLSGAYEIP